MSEAERKRLEELRSFAVLDTPPEEEFDAIVGHLASICQSAAAAITLVDRNRCWFKARVGLDAAEMPRDVSFCGAFFTSSSVFAVQDAAADERFRKLPLVSEPGGFRFYAGAPLISSEGTSLGTLCVLDHEPRSLTSTQLWALRALALEVVTLLEKRRPPSTASTPPLQNVIVVAEDEEAVRQLAGTALRRAGYGTLLAANGAEAYALFDANRDKVIGILTDIHMPVMTGADLAERLAEEPNPPLVFVMSGNIDPASRQRLTAARVASVLSKPFTIEELIVTISRAINAARSRSG